MIRFENKDIVVIVHTTGIWPILVDSHDSHLCTDTICKYNFVVRKARTMSYIKPDAVYGSRAYGVMMDGHKLKSAPYSVRPDTLEGVDADSDQVITADGYDRNVILINERFPGPTIEVMEGAQVVVEVTNHLRYQSFSIHWHGMSVKHTPWMDGTSYITQCPIPPKQKFTYRFKASPPGTHWYHAHLRNLRYDGLYGMMIVHKAIPSVPSFPLMVAEWLRYDSETFEILMPGGISNKGTGLAHQSYATRDHSIDGVQNGAITLDHFSIIINGRGRYDPSELTPYERFTVMPNEPYKFYLVHTGAEYNLEVSVDRHYLTVVASDGYEINPVKVTSIMIAQGETIDFTLDPDQDDGLYWMRITTLKDGKTADVVPDNIPGPEGFAILQYYGGNTTKFEEPTSSPRNCTSLEPCTVFNCPFRGYPTSHHKTCVGFGDVTSTLSKRKLDHDFGVSDTNYEEHFLAFNFAIGSNINGRKFIQPRAPLYQGIGDNIKACDPVDCQNGCFCTNILTLPYNKTIQMVVSSIQPEETVYSHHPVHLHGHSFAVLKVGYPAFNETTGHWTEINQDLHCKNKFCSPATWASDQPTNLNTNNPPIKDTLIIPARGYAVIRIRTDNPGFWLMHCHTGEHNMHGMAIVMHEAPEHIPQLPEGFPQCNDFHFSETSFKNYMDGHYKAMGQEDKTTHMHSHDKDKCGNSTEHEHNDVTKEVPDTKQDENMQILSIDVSKAIGASIGFILLGVILTLLPVCLYHQCIAKKWMKTETIYSPTEHINHAF